MASLHDIQDRFARAILENSPEIIADEIMQDGMTAQERHNIYRNNTFITLGQALADNFPVLCRLVGQTFFDHMAKEYVRLYPPVTPLLMSYGDRMAKFLADFKPADGLPYLSDVARLEYCWNESFNGQDSGAFDLDQLHRIAPEKFDDLTFSFLANLSLMESPYPVREIWLANQADADATREINLDSGGSYLAIYRSGMDVEVMKLDPAPYRFLEQLKAGRPLGLAAEETLGLFPEFNLQGALQHILQSKMIEGIELV